MDVAVTADTGRPDGQRMGPLERHHMKSEIFRNASQSEKLTKTHWHIAWANGLGWGFDGMDGAIFGLVTPMVIKEFAVDLPTFRSGRDGSDQWPVWVNARSLLVEGRLLQLQVQLLHILVVRGRVRRPVLELG